MNANVDVVTTPTQIDFDAMAAKARESRPTTPEYRAALNDIRERFALVESLVACRKSQNISQKEVAERMGVKQPTVSGFENEGSDPRLSTIQRYARAVDSRLKIWHVMNIESAGTWSSPSKKYEGEAAIVVPIRSRTPAALVPNNEPELHTATATA